jgi:RHS repeat-associated protein
VPVKLRCQVQKPLNSHTPHPRHTALRWSARPVRPFCSGVRSSHRRLRADRTIGAATASDVATLSSGTNRLAELRDGAGMLARGFAYRAGGDTSGVTRTGAPPLAYGYDARGRLTTVTSGVAGGASIIASYAYDWAEQRVAATSFEAGQRHYIHDAQGHLLAEHDALTGAMLREYVWLDDMPLALVSGAVASPVYSFITTGNLDEPLLLTDAAGSVTASTTRDPWGNPILLAGGTPLDLGYPGQWQDPATGLSQNWHRDYDPTLGRYVQADPIGLAGGANLYGYVGGDPVNLTDPTGEIVPILVGIGIGVGLEYLTNPCPTWQDLALAGALGGLGGGLGQLRFLRFAPRSLTRNTGYEWSHTIPKRMVEKLPWKWARESMNKRGGYNGNWAQPARHYRHDPHRYPLGWEKMGKRLPGGLKDVDRVPDWLKASAASGAAGSGAAGDGSGE